MQEQSRGSSWDQWTSPARKWTHLVNFNIHRIRLPACIALPNIALEEADPVQGLPGGRLIKGHGLRVGVQAAAVTLHPSHLRRGQIHLSGPMNGRNCQGRWRLLLLTHRGRGCRRSPAGSGGDRGCPCSHLAKNIAWRANVRPPPSHRGPLVTDPHEVTSFEPKMQLIRWMMGLNCGTVPVSHRDAVKAAHLTTSSRGTSPSSRSSSALVKIPLAVQMDAMPLAHCMHGGTPVGNQTRHARWGARGGILELNVAC